MGTMVLRYGEPDFILTILALFLIVSGIITTTRFISAIYIFPAILLGIWLGNSIHIQISEKRFRKMISIALFIIGMILLTKQWIGAGLK